MNWLDNFLMGLTFWLMRRWFEHSTVGYNKDENVVYIDFYVDEFDPNSPDDTMKNITFQKYDAK